MRQEDFGECVEPFHGTNRRPIAVEENGAVHFVVRTAPMETTLGNKKGGRNGVRRRSSVSPPNSRHVPVGIPEDVCVEQLFATACGVNHVIPFENLRVTIHEHQCAAIIMAFGKIGPARGGEDAIAARGGSVCFQGRTEGNFREQDDGGRITQIPQLGHIWINKTVALHSVVDGALKF